MSLVPLPEVQCGPVKPRRYPTDVRGTCNIDFGHRLKERSKCRVMKYEKGSVFDGGKNDEEEKRELKQFLRSCDFEKYTDRRIKKKNRWLRVQQGLAAYEETVEARREKLRDLVLDEESKLTREVIDQAQHGDDSRMEDMRQKSEELRKQQEEKRLEIVAAKRMQQYLAQCVEVREKKSKRWAIDAKHGNLAQISENEAKREAEKELDVLWHELMLKEVEAKKQRERIESENRNRANEEMVSILAKQIAGKLALGETERRIQREEREYLERLWEIVRQEELKNLEKDRQKREKVKRDLEEQIVTAKSFLAERAREEATMDRMLKELAEEELAKEREKIMESSTALRKEILAYLQYLEDIRQEEVRRSLEVDAIVEQSSKDAMARRDLAVRKFKEARQRSLQDVLQGRNEQIARKREEEQRRLQACRAEDELLEKQLQLDVEFNKQQRQEAKKRAKKYGIELKEQQKLADELKRAEIKRMKDADAIRDQEYQKLTQELLLASDNIVPHPFKVLLRECAERRAAEKEGRCYCPPPLSSGI